MKKIIKKFKTISGDHCISTAIKHIFDYFGHNISEEMIFGLASGLNFVYFEFKNIPYPIIGGRNKIGEFEENLAKNLNVNISINRTSSKKKAYDELVKLISQDIPVMIYADIGELDYLGIPEDYHFGGHAVVVYGIDEEKRIAYVSDRDAEDYQITLNQDIEPSDYHIVSLRELEKARGSKEKPYPPQNKWLTFDFKNIKKIDKELILKAIKSNVQSMLYAPIKNVGIKGIKLFGEKVLDWENFDKEKLKFSALNAFIFINQIGGTGGGIFRRMYGDFLKESSEIIKSKRLENIGNEYLEISCEWDKISDMFYEIYQNDKIDLLQNISNDIGKMYIKELELMQNLEVLLSEL